MHQTACLPKQPPLFIISRLSSTSAEFFCWKNVLCATGLYDCILLYIPAALMNSSVSCRSERSIYGMMLHGHTFKKTRAESLTECVMACNNGAMCQSVNYIINEDVCELNNRTKEARPDDLVPHENSIYVTRFSERGIGRGSRVVM